MSRSLIISALICLVIASGCSPKSVNPPEVNPTIAADYQEFYEKGVSQPAVAKVALERAFKADPENGYTGYLRASMLAAKLDFEKALEEVAAANKMKKVIIYVEEPMPGGSVQSLTRIRQLGFTVDKTEGLGANRAEYYSAIRTMGARVSNAIPINSLAVLNGTAVIKKSYQSEIASLKKAGDSKRVAELQTEFDRFSSWYKELHTTMSETSKDFIREAGKAAGLTAEELADYSDGHALKDKDKQKKADDARLKMYQEEVDGLQKALKTLPVK